ncbi:sortase [Christensenellaceae bacterium OttesenSCG-928-L17]|nr:sortase [Christensenellaceae bacterium OttesenSCG-928-L17]
MKQRTRQSTLAAILLLFLLCTGCAKPATPSSEPVQKTPAVSAAPAPTPQMPAVSPEPSAPPAQTPDMLYRYFPVRIEFVGYDVVSNIYPVGVTDDGETIATLNSAENSAWFHYFAAPLEEGNCIINGHNRWAGKDGTFSTLKRMAVGDEIQVTVEDGRIVRYSVTEIAEYTVDDFPMELLSNSVGTRLTLITCKGDYDHSISTSRTRVLLIAERTDVITPPGTEEMTVADFVLPEQLVVPEDVLSAAGAQPTP